jgi:hypothetical protein
MVLLMDYLVVEIYVMGLREYPLRLGCDDSCLRLIFLLDEVEFMDSVGQFFVLLENCLSGQLQLPL